MRRAHFSEHGRQLPKIVERKARRSVASSATRSSEGVGSEGVGEELRHYYEKDVKSLLKAAHMLHYCSIAILGVFVIQVHRYY